MESSLKAGPGCWLVGGGGSSAENGYSVGIPAGSVTDIPSLEAIRILGKGQPLSSIFLKKKLRRWLILDGTG